MCSMLSLCLLLSSYVFYSVTVKAFPASSSPSVQTLALTPFQLPNLDPNLRERADTHFVTIYGLYDNSLHASTSDSSKPKLAPITEAFMAMTRALATATATGSVVHSATPTLLHKPTLSALSTGLAIRPTTVRSSVAPSSTDAPKETLDSETLQRAAQTRIHRLVILGSVVAGVVCLSLLLFLLLDPRMMRKLWGTKVDDNMHFPTKNFYGSTKPSWDVSPISSSNYVFKDEPTEKPFFAYKNPVNEKQPNSKFSICSSVYPSSSESTSESEHGSGTRTSRSQTSPVRPPRPPTADSPALSDSVYLACADQPYIVVAPQPFTEIDRSLDYSPTLPTGPKIFSHNLLNVYAAHSFGLNINSALPYAQPNSNPTLDSEFYDNRHSRTYSAPSFVGSMNDQIYHRSERTVVQRMLKHRRSRSASGWAYHDRPPSNKGFNICN